MRRLIAVLTLAAAAFFGSACSSYYPYHSYRPAPAVANVVTGGVTEARVLAAVVGVRRPDDDAGTPALVEARLRVENHGERPLKVEPSEILLVTADLTALPGAFVGYEAGTALEVAPNWAENVELTFALPEGTDVYDHDLDGLSLRIELGGYARPVLLSLEFERLVDPYTVGWDYGPYLWHPWYGPYGHHYRYGFYGRRYYY